MDQTLNLESPQTHHTPPPTETLSEVEMSQEKHSYKNLLDGQIGSSQKYSVLVHKNIQRQEYLIFYIGGLPQILLVEMSLRKNSKKNSENNFGLQLTSSNPLVMMVTWYTGGLLQLVSDRLSWGKNTYDLEQLIYVFQLNSSSPHPPRSQFQF